MFQTSVPVMLSTIQLGTNGNIAQLLSMLQRTGATRVFLCPEFPEHLVRQCEKIRLLCPIFHSHGIEPAIWIGGSIYHASYPDMNFVNMVDLTGTVQPMLTCPSDECFVAHFSSLVAAYANTGVKLILLDDDFRINFNQFSPLCFCNEHLRQISEILGKDVTLEILQAQLLTGEPNTYRSAWLQANDRILTNFAAEIRKAVDQVAPDVNIALCSAPASWGADGTDEVQLSSVLSGPHPPLLRLSGAPYWPFFFPHMKLANIIDFARNQAAYCKATGITTFAEGDTYPRPRYETAASQLELYELAFRADGNANGILKYVLDYVAPLEYEQGYVKVAQSHHALYLQVEHIFGGKKLTGISVYEPFDTITSMNGCPQDRYLDVETRITKSAAIRLLNDSSIPSHFDPSGVTVVFGNAAKTLDLTRANDGLILDLSAAQILRSRGIDTGILADDGLFDRQNDGQELNPLLHQDPYLLHVSNGVFCPLTKPEIHALRLAESAEIVSTYSHGKNTCNGEYRYKNAAGQRFFVFPFIAFDNQHKLGMFRNYHRQKQLIDAYQWLCGNSLDAVCTGHPDLYIMTKKDEKNLAVGLWNLSLDSIDTPVVKLGSVYDSLETVGCTGELDGNTVTLSRLGAQEFCCFLVNRHHAGNTK